MNGNNMNETIESISFLGRPRNKKIHRAILDAALLLEKEKGYQYVTFKEIARIANVGRQTIYRRWPTKQKLYFELMSELMHQSATSVPLEEIDLEDYLNIIFKLVQKKVGTILIALLMDAQSDVNLLTQLKNIIAERRELSIIVLKNFASKKNKQFKVPIDLVADMLAGALWYRLLMKYAPIDDVFARELTKATEELL